MLNHAVPQDRAREIARVLHHRLVADLHLGLIAPGDRLPSVRRIAEEFRVDARTVLRACGVLEASGILECRPRSGMYVRRHDVPAPELSPRAALAAELAHRAAAQGIAPADLVPFLGEYFGHRSLVVACVGDNDDHAHAMGSIIESEYPVRARAVAVDSLDASSLPGGAIAVATTPFHVELVTQALTARVPVLVTSLVPLQGAELVSMLHRGTVYAIGTDARWIERAQSVFKHALEPLRADGANLCVLLAGDPAVRRIPADAPVFVTPRAAWALRGTALARRARVLRYTLSPASGKLLVDEIAAHRAIAERIDSRDDLTAARRA